MVVWRDCLVGCGAATGGGGNVISCNNCGGDIVAEQIYSDDYTCLILTCKECGKILDKEWRRKI